jgi:hypothetical protein
LGTPVTALRFINVFAGGIAAGGLLIVLVAYAKSLRELPAADAARLHSLFHPPTHVWMMRTTILGAATAVAIAALDPGWDASTFLVLAGIPGAATQAILSRFWVVPLSDELIAWPETGAPADARAFLGRWTLLHGGRVVGALESFTCYLLAALLN